MAIAAFVLAFGLVLLVWGLANAVDYAGVATRRASANNRLGSAMRSVPPWRWIPYGKLDGLPRKGYVMTRYVGGFTAACGLALVVVGLIGLVA